MENKAHFCPLIPHTNSLNLVIALYVCSVSILESPKPHVYGFFRKWLGKYAYMVLQKDMYVYS